MFKRIFWLGMATALGWLLWSVWRQRQDQLAATSPFIAPLEPRVHSLPTPLSNPPSATARPSPPEPLVAPATQASEQTPATSSPAPDPPTPAAEQISADVGLEGVIGYCPRCKTKRTISDAREEVTESGRRAARGICPVCQGRMFTFLPNK